MYLAKFIEMSNGAVLPNICTEMEVFASEYVNDGGMTVAASLRSAIAKALLGHELLGTDTINLVKPLFGTYADYQFGWDINHRKVPDPTNKSIGIRDLVDTRLTASDFKGHRFALACDEPSGVLLNMIQICTTGTRKYFRRNSSKGAIRVGYYETEFLVNVAGDVLHTYLDNHNDHPYNHGVGLIYRDRTHKLNINTIIDLDEIFLHTLAQYHNQKQES